jgi:hypothetical protein
VRNQLDPYTLLWLARRATAERNVLPMHVDEIAFNNALEWVARTCRKEARSLTKTRKKAR